MRAFQAIVTHGGVTRAADHLSLSQSAVSHKIKRLEESIDCAVCGQVPILEGLLAHWELDTAHIVSHDIGGASDFRYFRLSAYALCP